MTTSDFTTTLTVKKSAHEVFNAINNVRAWWSEEIEGITDQLNAEWNYHYQDVHRCRIRITELIPDKKIVWLVTDNYFSFTNDKTEWIGNKMIFEISETAGISTLRFTQTGLVPEYECFDICEGAWNTYIQSSLRDLILTGKGKPNSKENPQTEDEKLLGESFTTTFFVDESPAEVFNAINHVKEWWQGEITGEAEKTGDVFEYNVPGIHYSKQKVAEMIPDKKVVWLVTDSNLSSFQNKKEWNGTDIIFDIVEINGKTQLRFTHAGLAPKFQCYGDCSGAWEMLIQRSLHSLITTGHGVNVF